MSGLRQATLRVLSTAGVSFAFFFRSIICLILTIISIPLSMSIYLAWNFSTINKNLSLQLEQVKVLSQKNIEQEQETADLKRFLNH